MPFTEHMQHAKHVFHPSKLLRSAKQILSHYRDQETEALKWLTCQKSQLVSGIVKIETQVGPTPRFIGFLL